MSTIPIDRPGPPLVGATAPAPRRINTRRGRTDRAYRSVAYGFGVSTFLILVLIGAFLLIQALPAFEKMGWAFFTTPGWITQVHGHSARVHIAFGVEAALLGSVIIAVVALVAAVPISVAAALFISEYAPRTLFGMIPFRSLLTSVVDLMAAVPSVVYGLWGLFILQPHMKGICQWLAMHLSFIPIFAVPKTDTVYTSSFLIAGVLVGIMIVPIVTSISREIFSLTPPGEREGALALGASRARVIRDVVWPFGKGGFVGAVMLGLGRALGEAIAVSFIISLVYQVNFHVLEAKANSVAALIANLFGSGGKLGLHALLAAGLTLFVFTLVVNFLASVIVNRSRSRRG